MSFCVIAQIAVKSVVIAPKHRVVVKMVGLSLIIGWNRISRKIPATTIVLECRRADTGVGPSIAEGSQGWRPNWADLPVAAMTRPIKANVSMLVMKMCCRSHELLLIISQAIASMKPMSPIRLYRTACKAAVLASVRPNHQPISIKDIMPTPSHPMNN